MKWIVNDPFGFATSLRSFAGANIVLVNSGATDVYYDVESIAGTLNASVPGAIPTGTKIANGGGQATFLDCPRELWVRAATQTVIDIQSDAPAAETQPQRALAGVAPFGNSPNKATITLGAPLTNGKKT
jgi:hypothetical protein